MKYPLAIVTAAATAMLAMVRTMSTNDDVIDVDPDGPTPVPRINARLVEKLAYAGGTDVDIADRFLITPGVLLRDYGDVLRVSRALRRANLLSLQFDLARKLNGPMLTWLGRNELGQSLNPSRPGEAEPAFGEDDLA